MIVYEYPFNESIRTMLRLEHLFDRLGQLIARDAPVDHHYALATLFEIMDVGSRADLKSDLLKELERHRRSCSATAAIRPSRRPRSRTCSPASTAPSHGLNQLSGKAGAGAHRERVADEHPQPHQHPRRHLRVRPAGVLRLAAARCRRGAAATCCSWIGTLMPLAEALQVLLGLLRESGAPQHVVAIAGQYSSRACRPGASTS